MVKWRWPLLIVLLGGLGIAGWLWWDGRRPADTPPGPTQTNRPNVVLISLDTLRPDHLGCYGYDRPTSPNLDRFAARALRFSNCRAQAPWTLPSHMSLFTSMLPSHNGVDNLNKVLPDEITTLTQILRGEGYRTAALVNNGQMRAHWGFQRGFDAWREFEADAPAGNCESITREALAWLRADQASAPFFLFLHYYDTHNPYEAPAAFRKKLGATLTGEQTRQFCFRHRFPERAFEEPTVIKELMASYDAEIAWLDHELGKLFDALPANTMIVLFSDHGEGFKEHGWMLHGATLYDEEIRVPLLVKLPEATSQPVVIDESVMLMDVAPTILTRCGIRPPVEFQGMDLSPLWNGQVLRQRLIPSESKAVVEGRLALSVVLYPLKGIYWLFDGRFELYRLPDETRSLADTDKAAAEALFRPLRDWIESEQYWMIHAVGAGDYEATIELTKGRFGLFIPVGLDEIRDQFDLLDDGQTLRWHVYPGGTGRAKSLFLQPADPSAALRVDFKINGAPVREKMFISKDRRHPKMIPATVSPDVPAVSPIIDKAFTAEKPGFYVMHHRSAGSRPRTFQAAPLDEQTIRQLRSLGYLQ